MRASDVVMRLCELAEARECDDPKLADQLWDIAHLLESPHREDPEVTDPAPDLTIPRSAAVKAVDDALHRIQQDVDQHDWERAAPHVGVLMEFCYALATPQRVYPGSWK